MNVLSLFDGISCARVALERADIPVENYYASEIDKYAISMSQKNYPDILRLGNVVGLDYDCGQFCRQNGNGESNTLGVDFISDIDLLIGGSPCQDLSIAKRNRKGLDGDRSGLFWEYVRILKEVKPKYFILENVNSMPKEAKEMISKTLFDIQPVMINAALVSAQNRKRLFWVGKRKGNTYVQVDITQPEDRDIYLKDIIENNADKKYFLVNDNKLTPSGNPDIAGTLDTGTWSKRYEQIRRVYKISGKSPTIPTGTGGGVMTKIAVPVALRNRGYGKKPEYNGTGKANSLTTVQTDSMVDINTIIRKLHPIECERLQGLPDNYTEGISNTQRYKCCGNAFNADVVAHILSFIKL